MVNNHPLCKHPDCQKQRRDARTGKCSKHGSGPKYSFVGCLFLAFFFISVGLIYLFIYFSILLLLLLIRPLSSFTSFFVSVSNSSIITVLVVVRRQKVDAVDCENSNNATRQHGKDDGRSRGDCLKTT
jgi:hypothetical protein